MVPFVWFSIYTFVQKDVYFHLFEYCHINVVTIHLAWLTFTIHGLFQMLSVSHSLVMLSVGKVFISATLLLGSVHINKLFICISDSAFLLSRYAALVSL